MALACGFPIPVEGFAVPGLAADLLEAATVFFAAEVFAVGLCPCLSEPAFFSRAGFSALALVQVGWRWSMKLSAVMFCQ